MDGHVHVLAPLSADARASTFIFFSLEDLIISGLNRVSHLNYR